MINQAIDFLREHPEGVLATVSDNRPQTRVKTTSSGLFVGLGLNL